MACQIGIDVGYSANQASCGVSLRVLQGTPVPGWPAALPWWPSGPAHAASCTKMTLAALLAHLPVWVAALPGDVTVAIDGPLGPGGPPQQQRHVDRECQRGGFQNRAVPAPVVGGGAQLVAATYQVTGALVGEAQGPAYRMSPHRLPGGPRVQVLETMPTVGLAVVLPMVGDWHEVPSRKRPVGGRTDKSDFYWQRGAGARVAEVLGAPQVAADGNHDRRAAWYCLAVARQVDGGPAVGDPVCVGEPATGVYVLVGPVDGTWAADLDRVGRVP